MMELPDDIINVTIDMILPKHIHTYHIWMYNKYKNNTLLELLHPRVQSNIFWDIKRLKKRHNVSRKIIYTSLYTLNELRNTNTILKYLIDEKIKYDIELLFDLYMYYFQFKEKLTSIPRAKILSYIYRIRFPNYNKHPKIKTHITHSNSGCIICKRYLPYWWPSLEHQAPVYISSSVIEEWNKKTDTYIRDGCCSFKCYKLSRSIKSSKYIQNGERILMFCQNEDCSKFIHPTDVNYDDFHFCNRYCKGDYEYYDEED